MDEIKIFNESDLELVVSEKTLGSLTTNAKQIRDMVKASLPKYDISNYNDDNLEKAKADKAMLNKAAKALNAKRIEIEKEFMKPFGDFKEVVSETIQLIKQCSDRIDDVVKKNDQIYKEQKYAFLKDYFAVNQYKVPFEKVFKNEWLNRTAKEKKILEELDSIMNQINDDVESLKAFGEDECVLRTYYLETLNINATIQYAQKLKEQRQRAEEAEKAKQKAEEELKLRKEQELLEKERQKEIVIPKQEVVNPIPQPIVSEEQNKTESSPELLTRAFTVKTTKEKIIALGDFMNDNDIDFDKIDLDVTLCKTDLQSIAGMLEYGATVIEENLSKPIELNKARMFRNMVKKISKKIGQNG